MRVSSYFLLSCRFTLVYHHHQHFDAIYVCTYINVPLTFSFVVYKLYVKRKRNSSSSAALHIFILNGVVITVIIVRQGYYGTPYDFFSKGFSSSQDCMRISRITYFTFTSLYTKQPAISAKFSVQPKNTIIHPNLNVRGGGITYRERERESKGERELYVCVLCECAVVCERERERRAENIFILLSPHTQQYPHLF